jgi:hypothetical protein
LVGSDTTSVPRMVETIFVLAHQRGRGTGSERRQGGEFHGLEGGRHGQEVAIQHIEGSLVDLRRLHEAIAAPLMSDIGRRALPARRSMTSINSDHNSVAANPEASAV